MNKFRLFKLDANRREMDPAAEGYRDRPYYFKFEFRKERYPRCLETNDATIAQTRARQKYNEITQAVINGDYKRLENTKLRHEQLATIKQLIEAYEKGPSEAAAPARRTNVNALLALLGLTRENAGTETIAALTPPLIRKHFETVTTKALETTDQQAAASLKRSANSRWLQLASLFTPKCQAHYLDLGLVPNLTSIEAFLKAGKTAQFDKKKLKQIYRPPSEDIITKTLADWETLGRTGPESARDLFLIIGHELAFGLRVGEMQQARWNWHQVRNGYPVLDGDASAKNGLGLVQVRALDPWFNLMKTIATARGWWLADTGSNVGPSGIGPLVVTGTDTYRESDVYRSVSTWLRGHGWETQKTNHALRAYAGSQIAMRYTIWEASSWLRHQGVAVTEAHYTYFMKTFPVANKELIPARWAVLPAVPAPAPIVAEDEPAPTDQRRFHFTN